MPRFALFISMICILLFTPHRAKSQINVYEAKSILYNSLSGACTGAIGALINHKKDEKWHKAFFRGLAGGGAGGFVMYVGKQSGSLIVTNHNIAYGWLARSVFCAGNSIVENAASDKPLFSRFHFDLGFVRVDLYTREMRLQPSVMPLAFGATVFNFLHGRMDVKNTLTSGTFIFRTRSISYAPYLMGSTTGNGFILNDSINKSELFYELFAHEMLHTFQFMEFCGVNNFFNPYTEKWRIRDQTFARTDKWIHGDLNYLMMLGNYFLVNGGYKRSLYCKNFLENEAEVLSVGRVSCPTEPDVHK
jgi:hypothetical protein